MKNLRMILICFLCLGNDMLSLGQERGESLNRLLKDINGSLRLSVKEFNGTDLLSEQIFNKELLQTKTGNWSMQLKSNMAGAVWASIQNKHAAPGICTASGDYIFKLLRATGNQLYADLIRDIQHAHAEAVNMPGHLTKNNLIGSSMERIQLSDAEGKGSVGNFINTRNSWTETNGMLMALEIPGIYINIDHKKLYVFDHVKAQILSGDKLQITIQLANATAYDANVSVMAETAKQATKPLSYIAFLRWPKVKVKTGETIKVKINPARVVTVL